MGEGICPTKARSTFVVCSSARSAPRSPWPRSCWQRRPSPPRARIWPTSSFPTRRSKPRRSIPAGDYTTPDKVARKGHAGLLPRDRFGEERARFRHPHRDVAANGADGTASSTATATAATAASSISAIPAWRPRSNAATPPRTPTWERRRQTRSTAIRSSAIRRNGRTGGCLSTHVMTVVGKDDRQGLLWRGAEAFLLHGLLDRRAAGAHRSEVLSRRLRRHSDRRAGRQPDLGARRGRLGLYRRKPRAGAQTLGRQARRCFTTPPSPPAAPRGNGLKSDPFIADPAACDFDPASLTCQGAGCARLPDLGRGRDREGVLFRARGPRRQDALLRMAGGKRGRAAQLERSSKRPPMRRASRPSTASSNGSLGATGTGAISISIATCPRSTRRSGRSSTARRPETSARSRRAAASCSSSRAGRIRSSRPFRPSRFTRGSATSSAATRRRRSSRGSSWRRARDIAALAAVSTASTRRISGRRAPRPTDADHDLFTALARWVEDGAAPRHVIATSYVGNDASKGIAMQRPLCPYPQKAWYNGGGDPNIAANYTCAVDNK